MSNKLSAEASKHVKRVLLTQFEGMKPLDAFEIICNEVLYGGSSMSVFESHIMKLKLDEQKMCVFHMVYYFYNAKRNKKSLDWLRKRDLALILDRGVYTDVDDETEGGVLKIMKKLGYDAQSNVVQRIASFL